MPRQQDAQHSEQVRHVRSPGGAHFVQRQQRQRPEQAEEHDHRRAAAQPRYHEGASGHAHEHDHGRGGDREQLLIRPVQKGAGCEFAQVAQGEQGEHGLDERPAADQVHADPEEGAYEREERRERTPASLHQLACAARHKVEGGG